MDIENIKTRYARVIDGSKLSIEGMSFAGTVLTRLDGIKSASDLRNLISEMENRIFAQFPNDSNDAEILNSAFNAISVNWTISTVRSGSAHIRGN